MGIKKEIKREDVFRFMDKFLSSDLLKRKTTLGFILAILFTIFLLQNIPNYVESSRDAASYYTAAHGITQKINVYDEQEFQTLADTLFGTSPVIYPYLYFPVPAQLFVPLAQLKPSHYFRAIFILNLLCTCACLFAIYLLLKLKEAASPISLIFLFFLLCGNLPLFNTIHHGQINLMVFALILFSLYALKNNRLYLSALLLSLAVFFKIYPVLFLLLFLLQKRFKYLAWVAVNSAGIFLLSILIFSPQPWIDFITGSLRSFTTGKDTSFFMDFGAHINNYSLNGFVSQFLLQFHLPRSLVMPLILLMLGLFLFLFRSQIRLMLKHRDVNLDTSIILVLSLILSTITWSHHYVIMIFPFAYFFHQLIRDRRYIYIFPLGAFVYFVLYYPTWGGFPFNQFRLFAIVIFLIIIFLYYFSKKTRPQAEQRS